MQGVIGIDVGGTFTDFVYSDRATGRLVFHKEPSTPDEPSRAVATGVASLMNSLGSAPVGLVAHGTTLALNAILQRRGARLGLVVSTGNRDVLELARLKISDAYSFPAKPELPLVDREQVFEVTTRLDASGLPIRSADATELDSLCAEIAACGVDAVAVMLLNSYANPAAEIALSAEIARRLPELAIVSSAEIWPEIREYERSSVALLNAYISPLMRAYYDRLEVGLSQAGVSAPLVITASNGGTIDVGTAQRRPIDSILSGPASGVVAAIGAARSAGFANLVTFDMGGTSADIAVVESSRPEIVGSTQIGEIPLMLPVVNVNAIGAGGGSIVNVDKYGILKVGPRSAGADPGPVCYGRQSSEPAITDCYLACGFIDPVGFLGGRVQLDRAAAERALEAVAAPLGLAGAAEAAAAALKVATFLMATEVRKLLARRGVEPRNYTLMPFGGAGPTHAAMVADAVGIKRILIPRGPSTFCAFGATIADLRRDFVRSVELSLGTSDGGEAHVAAQIAGLLVDSVDWQEAVARHGVALRFDLSVEARYPGQAFDLTLGFERFDAIDDLPTAIMRKFHETHQQLYSFHEAGSAVQLRRISLSVLGAFDQGNAVRVESGQVEAPRRRTVFMPDTGWSEIDVRRRDELAVDASFAGPCVIEEATTTIVLTAGWEARLLQDGSILAVRA